MFFRRYVCFASIMALLIIGTLARPQDYEEDDDDAHSAASHHEHLGRVQVKVYRGPTEHDGHQPFAPWGFWVKQPADED